ncbi:MAG: polysaccharide deacetylase family protein [Paludibacter sp.]|jgi:hypothetical protein|nr:polysaccharide deacetylase family protein [Paludibacter sp.]
MEEIIRYILQLLTGTDESQVLDVIGYTNDPDRFKDYRLVIKASEFFDDSFYGTEASIPTVPLRQWEDVPILFGDSTTELMGDTFVIHADIVAGTYFLITRYEEMVRPKIRDAHGRFPGRESLPYKAGFIDRPIVEEWAVQLRAALRTQGINIAEPPGKMAKVYLTHDVDQLAHYRRTRGMLGGVLRGIKRKNERKMALKSYFGGVIFDPWYTFPYLYKLDTELQRKLGKDKCEVITFIRSGGGRKKEDKPESNLAHPDYKHLLKISKRKKVSIGLHTSYEAGIHPQLVGEEKKLLEAFTATDINYNRNHFLNNREPSDLNFLIDAGITDDFSMGYADIAGFRLGTCRQVRWINPLTRKLTPLVLHSLTIMDVTLSEKRYMFMNAHDAFQYCCSLIDTVERYNGEISLLWHNNTVEKNASLYHRQLYKDLLDYIHEKEI